MWSMSSPEISSPFNDTPRSAMCALIGIAQAGGIISLLRALRLRDELRLPTHG